MDLEITIYIYIYIYLLFMLFFVLLHEWYWIRAKQALFKTERPQLKPYSRLLLVDWHHKSTNRRALAPHISSKGDSYGFPL